MPKLLPPVKGFRRGGEHLDEDRRIEDDIPDLVMKLQGATDNHQVRIGKSPRCDCPARAIGPQRTFRSLLKSSQGVSRSCGPRLSTRLM